jgi:tetratricopeptide (TPR) repeat protein
MPNSDCDSPSPTYGEKLGATFCETAQYLALAPDYSKAWNSRGNALIALKREAEALGSCDRAVMIQPDYPRSILLVARILKQKAKAGSSRR